MDINSGDTEDRWSRGWLGLGGNIGDVLTNMRQALKILSDSGNVRLNGCSSLYETPPWGIEDQPVFLNICVEISSRLSAVELLELCQDVEVKLKRKRLVKWGPRTIDVDILLLETGAIDLPDLEIPHPRILQRAFVLVPLAEIAPEQILLGQSIAHWRSQCDDKGINIVAKSDVFDDLLWQS